MAAAVPAQADIVIARQSGSIIVSGDQGTLQDFPLEDVPWTRTLTSGAGAGSFTGEGAVAVSWTADQIVLATTASISTGAGAPVLTQAFVQMDIEFELTGAADVEVRYDVVDGISVPPPPFVFITTRVVDLTTIEELQTEPGTYHFSLPAGPYRLEIQNMMGNSEGSLGFNDSARTITGTFKVLPVCDIDFNNDGLFPDVQDITDCLYVFAGGVCPTGAGACDSVDFNHDEIFPDTQDIADFLTVFAGGAC